MDMKLECPLLLVGQLSKMTNKTPRALRMYEDMGLLSPVERSSSGYRKYDQRALDQVRYIEKLQLMGLSLTDIQKWVQEFRLKVSNEQKGSDIMVILQELYVQKHSEIQKKILELQKMNEQLELATNFLQGCTSCEESDIPTACSTCREHEDFSTSQQPELIVGMLSMVD